MTNEPPPLPPHGDPLLPEVLSHQSEDNGDGGRDVDAPDVRPEPVVERSADEDSDR